MQYHILNGTYEPANEKIAHCLWKWPYRNPLLRLNRLKYLHSDSSSLFAPWGCTVPGRTANPGSMNGVGKATSYQSPKSRTLVFYLQIENRSYIKLIRWSATVMLIRKAKKQVYYEIWDCYTLGNKQCL